MGLCGLAQHSHTQIGCLKNKKNYHADILFVFSLFGFYSKT